ncbi:MAG: multidrug effflux MFS transporter [Pseudomonadales bacterium]
MQIKLLSLLMAMVVLSPMAIDIYLPSVEQIGRDLAASDAHIQSLISLFFFSMGAGQLFVGPLADRYGRKPVVVTGLLFYAISAAVAALSENILLMQLTRVVQGFAACAISVAIFSMVRDRYSYAKSGKIYSYLNGVISVVPALAPLLGGFLALQFGWRAAFVFMFGYAAVVLLVVCWALPETLTRKVDTVDNRWGYFKEVLSSRYFLFYAFCCTAAMASILCYVSYAPIWLLQHVKVSPLAFSVLFGLNACASILSCFVGPKLIARNGNRFVVNLGLWIMLLAAIVLYLSVALAPAKGLMGALAFMLPVMLLSAGFAMLLGPAASMALSQFAHCAGVASALLGFLQMAGASLIVFLLQLLAFSPPDAVVIMLLLVVLPLLFVMHSHRLSSWHAERSSAS